MDIDKTVIIGNDNFIVTEQKNLMTPLGVLEVFIANHSDGRSYWFESNTGLLLGFYTNIASDESWDGVWNLSQTNAEIDDSTTTTTTTTTTTSSTSTTTTTTPSTNPSTTTTSETDKTTINGSTNFEIVLVPFSVLVLIFLNRKVRK